MKNLSGANVVPEPLYQLSGYELDLIKCCCFGWINACSLGFNLWQQLARAGQAE